jgi:hypothetical protein
LWRERKMSRGMRGGKGRSKGNKKTRWQSKTETKYYESDELWANKGRK